MTFYPFLNYYSSQLQLAGCEEYINNSYIVELTNKSSLPEIKNVIFNDPATIVFWEDGTKTVVKCQEEDTYSKETGFAMCLIKKFFDNSNSFNELFKKWVYTD